jgi:pyruvate,orthophosphate dikinase
VLTWHSREKKTINSTFVVKPTSTNHNFLIMKTVRAYKPLTHRGNCLRCGMIRDSHQHGAGDRPASTVPRNAPAHDATRTHAPITHRWALRAAQHAADPLLEVHAIPQTSQRVHQFVRGESTGSSDMKSLLGGKGANLCEMAKMGLNVPPGLVISTTVCQEFHDAGKMLPSGLMEEVRGALKRVETTTGRIFGDTSRTPLLLSVRSGAAVSMPGMMDTVLNLGLNDETLPVMAAEHGWRLTLDCYRRLLDMFGDVVCGISHDLFEQEMAAVKRASGITYDIDMSEADLRAVIDRFKKVYEREGKSMPTDPYHQLEMAVAAVFGSWNTARAVKYRELNHITGLIGTAVNIQSMVFGNLNENSATGVCFTRNPATGEPGLYGEFLLNAQGEDVVAGIRTPLPVKDMAVPFPEAYAQLVANAANLERHFSDMQDIEFTVQDGQLYILQTRNGKRTGAAALRVAVDLKNEGLVTQDEAVLMVEPRHLEQLMHPVFENPVGSHAYKSAVLAKGLPASPGAACGQIVFTAEAAEKWKSEGKPVVLVRTETSPEDVGGMHAAVGIFTSRGGMTSHAAVVARGWGKPCVCGCEKLDVCQETKTATIGQNTLSEGDWISLNGTTGEVLLGKQPTKKAELSDQLAEFMSWADAARRMGVMANCDTPKDAAIARANGAAGIGLVRTEHMFFSSAERIKAVRRMIAAEELGSKDESIEALAKLKDFQKEDFKGIFRCVLPLEVVVKTSLAGTPSFESDPPLTCAHLLSSAMDGLEVTIRLLDPPLHEFLPKEGPELASLCDDLLKSYHAKPAGQHMRAHKLLQRRLEGLNEANPMMGLRGCRLGIVHPDITAMQAAAIIEAAVECQGEGVAVYPAIMIPLVGFEEELVNQLRVVREVAEQVFNDSNNSNRGSRVDIKVGTMIEVPRAALISAQLAKHCDFFSIGSNDLTQMTLGFSRDDAEAKFMSAYLKEGIIPHDPFDSLDATGVGELIKLAVERGRSTKANLRVGICGEHGGDPKSISFVNGADLDYVSCSPLRVPVARLAAAQAEINARASMANDHCQD